MIEFFKKLPGLKSGIGRRFILYILLFSSVITFVGTGLQLYFDFDRDLKAIHTSFKQIESSYLHSITNSLWITDDVFLRIQLEGILKLPDMQLIEVRKGAEILQTVGTPQSKNIIEQSIPLVFVYNDRDVHLGELHVVASLKGAYTRIFDRVLVILSIQTIKTFLVSFFIFIIFYQLVGKHIIYMASFVESMDFESLDEPLYLGLKPKKKRPDELDLLVNSFNRMRDNLARDVIQREIAEKELNLSKKRYQALFQHSPIPLWEEDFTEVYHYIEKLRDENVQDFRKYFDINPSLIENLSQKVKILDVNQEALKLHDAKTKEELLGNLDKIFTKKSLDTFKEEIITLSKGFSTFESEGEVKTLSGEKKAILLKMTIERERHDSCRALIATMDITYRNHMEERLRQAQKIESIGNLAGGIAHDFNNLLFPILGMSEMLLEDLPDDSLEYENAKEIFYAAKRAGDLVKQILTFSRQAEHKMTPIRVQNMLKEVLKLCRSTIPSNIEIHENIQQNCGLVMADPTQVHQVVMNLITNAFHAVEENNGVIDIELKEVSLITNELPDSVLLPGEYVRLSVSDNGIGMIQSTINQIFDPYFTTKKQGKGTGLGLAVVYGIVKEHKGDIKVYSEEGEGTTFNVYLPSMKKHTETFLDIQEGQLETGTERILLVDDEKSIVRLEKQLLERLGYSVSAQSNSLEALETFNSNPFNYDLVISDMTMPNLTGDQLARELMSIRPDIPIIICTGFSERINKEQAEVIGVKGFLMKPVVKYDMAQMVRNVLDAAKDS